MQMLKGFGAAVKRGKHQALQRVGLCEETKDEEYDESRERVKQCKAMFKGLERQVKTLEANVSALNSTFGGIVTSFGEFGHMLDPEGEVKEFADIMETAVKNMTEQTQMFAETVTSNSLEIVRTAQQVLEESEAAHKQVRESQIDMDALKHDVRILRDSISDTKLSSSKAEKAKAQLISLETNLESHISTHNTITRTSKKEMAVATSDASASLWSIYSILFTQTEQHFKDLSEDMGLLSNALTSVKNSGLEKIKEQRYAVLPFPYVTTLQSLCRSPLMLRKSSSYIFTPPRDPAFASPVAKSQESFQSPPNSNVPVCKAIRE